MRASQSGGSTSHSVLILYPRILYLPEAVSLFDLAPELILIKKFVLSACLNHFGLFSDYARWPDHRGGRLMLLGLGYDKRVLIIVVIEHCLSPPLSLTPLDL